MSATEPLPYYYRLSAPAGHYELAALEFRALTGDGMPGPIPRVGIGEEAGLQRIFRARLGVDVARSAYVAECSRLLVEAAGLEELLGSAEKLALRRDRFRVTVRTTGDVAAPETGQIERAVADIIEGSPDLSRPATEMTVTGAPEGWLLGELVSRTGNRWQGHEQRPFQYSSALPPRVARALVNLVAVPGDKLIDPCCGVGTALVEASEIGIEAFGWETNPVVAEHAAANICHHNQGASIVVGDGRKARGRWHGAVLDLPYGQQSVKVDSVCAGLVECTGEVADLIAVVALDDLTGLLESLSFNLLGVAELRKNKLVRRVHWAQKV